MDTSIDDDGASLQTLGDLPCFMELGPNGIDGWKPPSEPMGDYDFDFAIGGIYADMAVLYARETAMPAALTFIISSMCIKAARRELVMGAREAGFLDRVARLAYVGSLS